MAVYSASNGKQHEDSTNQTTSIRLIALTRQQNTPTSPGTWQAFVSPSSGPIGNAIDCLLVGADIHGCPPRTIDVAVNSPISAHAGNKYRQSCQSSTTTDQRETVVTLDIFVVAILCHLDRRHRDETRGRIFSTAQHSTAKLLSGIRDSLTRIS